MSNYLSSLWLVSRRFFTGIVMCSACVTLTACNQTETDVSGSDKQSAVPSLAGFEAASANSVAAKTEATLQLSAEKPKAENRQNLVEVGGSVITEGELASAMKATFGNLAVRAGSDERRKTILNVLVQRRMFAQAAGDVLSGDEKQEVAFLTNAYKEQLLMSRFLRKKADVEAVSTAMIETYYQENRAEWMDKGHAIVEILRSESKISAAVRDRILLAFTKGAESSKDWDKFAQSLATSGLPVSYWKGRLSLSSVDRRLARLIEAVGKQGVSKPTLLQGKVHQIRVLDLQAGAEPNMKKVAPAIRQRLEAIKVREALQKVAETLKAKTLIRYLKDEGGNASINKQ